MYMALLIFGAAADPGNVDFCSEGEDSVRNFKDL